MNKTNLLENRKIHLITERKEDLPSSLIEYLQLSRMTISSSTTDDVICAADFILVYITDEQWGESITKNIRSRMDCFLKPLAIISENYLTSIQDLVDEQIILPANRLSWNASLEKLCAIADSLEQLFPVTEQINTDRAKELLLLQFLHSRKNFFLKPVVNLASCIAFSYTMVQELFNCPAGRELVYLEALEEYMLLKGKLVDKINLCPYCNQFQVNFREVCPGCASQNIIEEATIHHYRCAFIGREKEFRDGYNLCCPKCGKELRHIGVDYDKPSEDLWCQDCGLNFFEPAISCYCLYCGKTFGVQHAISRHIKEFSITAEGLRAAETGVLPSTGLVEFLRGEIGLYKLPVFKEFFRLETLRCKRYGYSSVLMRLIVENFTDIIRQDGLAASKKIKKDLSMLFKSTFRDTDIIADRSDTETLIMLTHTDLAGAQTVVARLEQGIKTIFKHDITLNHTLQSVTDATNDLEDILARQR